MLIADQGEEILAENGFSIIGTVGVPACYGGFESLVENLLPSTKVSLIYCSSKAYKVHFKTYKDTPLMYLPFSANGAQSVIYDLVSIGHSLLFTRNDLLILGVSGSIGIPIFKLFSDRRVVTNIDGLEWRRDKWGRFGKWFLKFSEGIAVKFSDITICDNQAIADYVEATYGVVSNVIAYGGDHAVRTDIKHQRSKEKYGLALCRIEPENNVEMILDAFARCQGTKLWFIGNWDNSEYGRSLRQKYGSYENIRLYDPIYDLDILFEIRSNCSFYVHGHSAGGTNPSLVEMMHFSKPIFAFDCIYNRATTENNADFFGDSSVLADLVLTTFKGDSAKMLEIANRRYTWQIVKKQYLELF